LTCVHKMHVKELEMNETLNLEMMFVD
jgi:hypothetical protein